MSEVPGEVLWFFAFARLDRFQEVDPLSLREGAVPLPVASG
jgi:hypothetical protein